MDIISIQYLRGIAAMMVVVVHLHPQLERMGYQGYWPHWLAAGVDIFFVLSGFLMWITTRDRKVGVLEFYRRRAVRIVPLYWLLTSVAVAVMLIAPQLMQTTRFGLFHVIASYFFVMVPNPAGLIEPVLTVGWTLNYEMLYYVIFGLTLVLPTAWRFAATAIVLVGISMLGWFVVGNDTPILKVYTSDIVLEFLLGMGIGWWFSRPHKGGSAALGWLLVLGGFAAIALASVFAPEASRPLAQGVPSAAIVMGAILLERFQALPRFNVLHTLGDASYSIYLSHAFVLSALSQGWRKLNLDSLPGGRVGFCVVGIVACAVAGLVVYYLMEKPLINLFKKPREQEASKAATRRSVAGL